MEGRRSRASGKQSDRGTLDVSRAHDIDRNTEQVDHVDKGPGRFERGAVGVQLELHGAVAEGVERHELRRYPAREGVVEETSTQYDPALEEALVQPGAVGFVVHLSS